MNGTKEAVKLWEKIPNEARLKLLNNVLCRYCKQASGISNATAVIISQDFLLKGDCIQCGNPVVRYIEITVPSSPANNIAHINANVSRITRLLSYSKHGKTDQLISDLTPLKLQSCGHWDPNKQELFEGNDDVDTLIYSNVVAFGTRSCWEMEQILPGDIPGSADYMDDPILKGLDIREHEGFDASIQHFKSLLKVDARCLDAYAHIGNTYYHIEEHWAITQAKSYYKQGAAIGWAAIGKHINDVFLWGLIDNRPFLRCLKGFGLCLLWQNKVNDALAVFRHMLLFNPIDNQGIRFIIAEPLNTEL